VDHFNPVKHLYIFQYNYLRARKTFNQSNWANRWIASICLKPKSYLNWRVINMNYYKNVMVAYLLKLIYEWRIKYDKYLWWWMINWNSKRGNNYLYLRAIFIRIQYRLEYINTSVIRQGIERGWRYVEFSSAGKVTQGANI